MTGILLVDDHPAVVDSLRTGLARLAGVAVGDVASSLTEARSVLSREGAFDLALVDVRLGDGSGFEVLGLVDPDRTATVLMSGYPSRAYLEGALHLGARGLLGKHRPLGQLVAAIGEVAAGGVAWDGAALRDRRERPWRPLTGRERDVVAGLLAGRSNQQIALALGVTAKTVESHLTDLYVAHGLHSRSELALLADREGWLDVPAW